MSLSKNDTEQNPKKRNLHKKINNLFLTKSIMKKVMVDSLMREDADAGGSLTSVGSEDVFEMFDAIGLEEHQQD